jgi:pyruvate dehydrogenase E1 component alpha subunit
MAMATTYQGKDDISIAIFGDGATDMGEFHETLNLASVWKLPVVFLCENNLYAMGTPMRETTAASSIAEKAAGYNMPTFEVDGQDVLAVYRTCAEAYAHARSGQGPVLIEALTYRYRGHSAVDPQLYRSKEEVLERKSNDPVKSFPRWLVEMEILNQSDLDRIEKEILAVVDDSVQFAEESPEPSLDELYTDVYADPTGFELRPSWAK